MVQIRPSWLPWQAGLILPWLGVLGIGLKRVKDQQAGWWARTDLAMGLGLLFCLAPLPVFAAAQAPLRYGDNLSPLGAVLLVRGMASLIWGARRRSMARKPYVTQAVWAGLGTTLLATAVQDAAPARKPLYPTLEEVGYWQLGQALMTHFEPGSGVASPVREALVEGRLSYCPQRICPERAAEDACWECLSVHALGCDGPARGVRGHDRGPVRPQCRRASRHGRQVASKWTWSRRSANSRRGFTRSARGDSRARRAGWPLEPRGTGRTA